MTRVVRVTSAGPDDTYVNTRDGGPLTQPPVFTTSMTSQPIVTRDQYDSPTCSQQIPIYQVNKRFYQSKERNKFTFPLLSDWYRVLSKRNLNF